MISSASKIPFSFFAVQYCSGDVWTGTVQKPTNATFNFYFSGHLNFAAVLDFLSEYAGLGS